MPTTSVDELDVVSTDTTARSVVVAHVCRLTGSDEPTRIDALLSDLNGSSDEWTITVREPSRHEPHGALLFDNTQFDEHTGVYISSTDIDSPLRDSEQEVTYDVYNPMSTDILTVSDDIEDIVTAVQAAVERANRERSRSITPRASVIQRVSTALFG